MKKIIIAAAAILALGSVANAETVLCPTGATPAACAENQAVHDAFLAGSYIGQYPVFRASAVDPRAYLGSDPDANVRLALRRVGGDNGGMDASKK